MGSLRDTPIVFLAFGLFFSFQAHSEPVLTLPDCYQRALETSERHQLALEEIREAKGRFQSALGKFLPHFSGHFTETLQDASSVDGSDSAFSSTFTQTSRPEAALTATQPLFQGLQEIYALKRAGSYKREKRETLEEAKRLLFKDVAIAFYTLAGVNAEIKTHAEIIRVLSGLSGEFKKRVDLGKTRKSELALQETELGLSEAELESLKGARLTAIELLSFLTGLSPPFSITFQWTESLSLEEYLGRAGERPDVKAALEAAQGAKHEWKMQAGEFLPEADVEANYYPHRTGFQEEIKWDVIFSAKTPLFNLENIGGLKEAKSRWRQARLKAEETHRQAQSEVKKAYEDFQASSRGSLLFDRALAQAKKGYQLALEDFRHGLIDSVELLNARHFYFEALKEAGKAKVRKAWAYTALEIAAGIMPHF